MRIVKRLSLWLVGLGVAAAVLSLAPRAQWPITANPGEAFIAPIPEPSTLVLLSVGFAAAWWHSRRRDR